MKQRPLSADFRTIPVDPCTHPHDSTLCLANGRGYPHASVRLTPCSPPGQGDAQSCGHDRGLSSGSGPRLPVPNAAHVEAMRRASGRESSLAQLSNGRAVALAACGGCHRLPSPALVPSHRWPALLADMAARAQLDAREREDP